MTNKKQAWVLINNNSHKVLKFGSKKALFDYAKKRGYEIKIGKYGLTDRTYYTESTEYIPGNR